MAVLRALPAFDWKTWPIADRNRDYGVKFNGPAHQHSFHAGHAALCVVVDQFVGLCWPDLSRSTGQMVPAGVLWHCSGGGHQGVVRTVACRIRIPLLRPGSSTGSPTSAIASSVDRALRSSLGRYLVS